MESVSYTLLGKHQLFCFKIHSSPASRTDTDVFFSETFLNTRFRHQDCWYVNQDLQHQANTSPCHSNSQFQYHRHINNWLWQFTQPSLRFFLLFFWQLWVNGRCEKLNGPESLCDDWKFDLQICWMASACAHTAAPWLHSRRRHCVLTRPLSAPCLCCSLPLCTACHQKLSSAPKTKRTGTITMREELLLFANNHKFPAQINKPWQLLNIGDKWAHFIPFVRLS